MPLYEYQCTKCKKRVEKIQPMSAEPVLECPDCGAQMERLLSAPAFQFKGTGWYITDYSRKNGVGASSSSAGSSSADSKPESKPETKTESKPSESKGDSK